MPRVLSIKEAEQRGAKRRDGTVIKAPEPVAPMVKETPVIAAPTIDVSPIAGEIGRMTEIVKSALSAHTDALGKMAEKPIPEDFEFTVTERDTQGRIVKIKAQRITKKG